MSHECSPPCLVVIWALKYVELHKDLWQRGHVTLPGFRFFPNGPGDDDNGNGPVYPKSGFFLGRPRLLLGDPFGRFPAGKLL